MTRVRRKNPYAVKLAKRAVAKGAPARGGKARMNRLTPEQRSELGRKAVRARWARAKAKKQAKD